MTMIATTTMMAMSHGAPCGDRSRYDLAACRSTWPTGAALGSARWGPSRKPQDWAETVRRYGERHELTYEPVGGINPKDGPVALCVGGTNRLTGQLAEGFWGSCCDADEKEVGSLFNKAVLPTALLAKAHMPDLARSSPPSTSSRSRATRSSPSASRARSSSSRSTSTGASRHGAAASTTRSPCASCSAPASSTGRRR